MRAHAHLHPDPAGTASVKIPRTPRRGNSVLLVSLVDVLFVLLLFFLLASKSLAPPAVPLALASGASAAPPSWSLRLSAGGQAALNGEAMKLDAALTRLRAAATSSVRLQVGEGVPTLALMAALEGLRPAGIAPLLERAP